MQIKYIKKRTKLTVLGSNIETNFLLQMSNIHHKHAKNH